MRLEMLLMVLVVFLGWRLCLCGAIEVEAMALLRFRDGVEVDPYGVLDGWGGDRGMDPCSWFGVDCSGDGRVVSLNLKDLYLEGTLSPDLAKLTHTKSLVLRNNSFYGVIPREFGKLKKLVLLDLTYNNLSGPIPKCLASISFLELLNNRFISISPEFHKHSMLSWLQTAINHLRSYKGSVKRNVGNASIRRLLQLGNRDPRRSNRNGENQTNSPALSAPLPSPAPTPFNPPEISPPSSPTPISLPPSTSVPSPSPAQSPSPISEPPSPTPDSNSGSGVAHPSTFAPLAPLLKSLPPQVSTNDVVAKLNTYWKVFLSIGLGLLLILALILSYVLCFRSNKIVTVRPWATGLSEQLQKAFVEGVPSLERVELEIACESFSNVIGSLPGCNLYKGTLSSGVEIAVVSSVITSAKYWSKQSEAQFRKKISTLSKVNHKNFVNLIGYCEENEPFARMMVFEYAPNGTLFEHLHISEFEPLDCAARLRVAMGIAYCLEHMHHLNPPVILGNIDSSSIYLTDDYAAKISDLGFWNTPKEVESLSRSPGPADTPTSNPESIVYKFGIILLEILSGRLPFNEEDGLLEQWASCFFTNEMVDPSLKSLRKEETSALCAVIRSCISSDPTERLTMTEVVRQLRAITKMPPEAVTPKQSPLWWAELEIISTEAN